MLQKVAYDQGVGQGALSHISGRTAAPEGNLTRPIKMTKSIASDPVILLPGMLL